MKIISALTVKIQFIGDKNQGNIGTHASLWDNWVYNGVQKSVYKSVYKSVTNRGDNRVYKWGDNKGKHLKGYKG